MKIVNRIGWSTIFIFVLTICWQDSAYAFLGMGEDKCKPGCDRVKCTKQLEKLEGQFGITCLESRPTKTKEF